MKMSPSDEAPNQVCNNCLQNGSSYKSSMSLSQDPSLTLDERLKILYPHVDEEETPLPRCWSTKDKYNFIGLSKNNLLVNYKGYGKTHKDASSVRATHPIPPACGIYYFEVRIISKGRDGYMGIGLCAQGVSMNRLPGWDKFSYGYHGDDGHSFCSSGTGQMYGPTFTTGDVIGCGLNFVEGSCFYTKNGHHLGTAFTDLPPNLYPTVGLQTPGETVEANFGQEPFLFDVESEMSAVRARIHRTVESLAVPGKHGAWQDTLNKLVCSYLVHHGFFSTAEAFSRATGQNIAEDWASIRNRQKIQKLILTGQVGKAIAQVNRLYPGFLQTKPSLHFMLKVRQFIEMVSGQDNIDEDEDSKNVFADDSDSSNDVVMSNGKETNGSSNSTANSTSNSNLINNNCSGNDMEVDEPRRWSVVSNPARFDKLIHFGRGLQAMLNDLEVNKGIKNEQNTRMLRDAFAMLAYQDPWDSPVGWQLASSQREQISAMLNSALLEDRGFPAKPPLEVALGHAKYLAKQMAASNLGACAYASLQDFIE